MSRRRGLTATGATLATVVAAALGLRLWGVAWGLPYCFLNVDESVVVGRAWTVAQGSANPEFFYYPSLFFYVLAGVWRLADLVARAGGGRLLEATALVTDPGPLYLLGRLVSVAAGTATAAAAFVLGRAAYGRFAGLGAAAAVAVMPLAVTYSHMAVTDAAAAAGGTAALALLAVAVRDGRPRLLVWAAVAAGLATSTKYNLGLLVLPLSLAGLLWLRDAAGGAGLVAGPARRVWLPMLAAFLAGSPFVVLDLPHFLRDFTTQSRIMARGWLGYEHAGNGLWYDLAVNLPHGMGPPLLVLALAGLGIAVLRRTRHDLLLLSFVLPYLAVAGTWHALADRYLLPLLPPLAVLGFRAAGELAGALLARRRLAQGVLLAGLTAAALAPAAWAAAAYDHGLRGTDTRLVARRWVEAHLPPGSRVACENYGPPLVRWGERDAWRAAGQAPPAYRVVRLPLPNPGVPQPRRDLGWLAARGVRYVVVSSAVRDRVLAAAEVYPRVVAFYAALEARAERLAVIRPGRGQRGPTLIVYRLPAQGGPAGR